MNIRWPFPRARAAQRKHDMFPFLVCVCRHTSQSAGKTSLRSLHTAVAQPKTSRSSHRHTHTTRAFFCVSERVRRGPTGEFACACVCVLCAFRKIWGECAHAIRAHRHAIVFARERTSVRAPSTKQLVYHNQIATDAAAAAAAADDVGWVLGGNAGQMYAHT